MRIFVLIALVLLFWTQECFSERRGFRRRGGSSSSGGPFLQLHTSSLSSFDSEITGSPVVIGGIGMGSLSRSIRVGGGGGGAFLFRGSSNVQFGMGYGGVAGEYVIASWLNARLLIGGGGYAIVKILSETETQKIVRKVSSGGFILFHPSANVNITITRGIKLVGSIGYFLPNVGDLSSLTVSASVMIGGGSRR